MKAISTVLGFLGVVFTATGLWLIEKAGDMKAARGVNRPVEAQEPERDWLNASGVKGGGDA